MIPESEKYDLRNFGFRLSFLRFQPGLSPICLFCNHFSLYFLFLTLNLVLLLKKLLLRFHMIAFNFWIPLLQTEYRKWNTHEYYHRPISLTYEQNTKLQCTKHNLCIKLIIWFIGKPDMPKIFNNITLNLFYSQEIIIKLIENNKVFHFGIISNWNKVFTLKYF